MVIDLKRFFREDTPWERMEIPIDLTDVEEAGEPIFPENGTAHAELRGLGGVLFLRAQAQYAIEKPCDRCGKRTRREFTREFSHTLVMSLEDMEPDDDEVISVPDGTADLSQVFREDVLLDLPAKFLCREDCKGLCPRCGKDLNEGECSCDRGEIDPRLEALKALL